MQRSTATPLEIARLQELVAQGLSVAKIAKEMQRSIGTTGHWIEQQGLHTNHYRPPPWTEEEVDRACELRESGKSFVAIGKIIGRSGASVGMKLREPLVMGAWRRRHRQMKALPVAKSDWMKELTPAQLMGRRA